MDSATLIQSFPQTHSQVHTFVKQFEKKFDYTFEKLNSNIYRFRIKLYDDDRGNYYEPSDINNTSETGETGETSETGDTGKNKYIN